MRLIDSDRLLTDKMKSKYYHLQNGDTAIPIIDIEHAPTVEAIPKADYENRLKADMVAMLTELQLELEELPEARFYKKNEYGDVIGYIEYPAISKEALLLIQQKINKLKGD